MQEELTKNLAEELRNIKGEARGVVFKTDADFVLQKKGEGALEKVKEELKKVGQPINYANIKAMNFYPIGLRIISLLAIKQALGLSDKEIEQMGAEAPKISLVIRFFTKFLFSLSETVKQAPKMWEKHYTVGELSAEADETKRRAIVRLGKLDLNPIFCIYLKGYFATIIHMIVNKPVTSKEIKCPFKNKENPYHEYLFQW